MNDDFIFRSASCMSAIQAPQHVQSCIYVCFLTKNKVWCLHLICCIYAHFELLHWDTPKLTLLLSMDGLKQTKEGTWMNHEWVWFVLQFNSEIHSVLASYESNNIIYIYIYAACHSLYPVCIGTVIMMHGLADPTFGLFL